MPGILTSDDVGGFILNDDVVFDGSFILAAPGTGNLTFTGDVSVEVPSTVEVANGTMTFLGKVTGKSVNSLTVTSGTQTNAARSSFLAITAASVATSP